ncbi:MAG: exo-alpha-sialidase [Phascolarctobacterium sp.]|nr:exo-alpha-sialidase [Phascolarctobacterium sp.]
MWPLCRSHGRSWVERAGKDGRGAEANYNPVLFYREDGTLLLFYKEGQQIVQGHQVHISYTFDRKHNAAFSLEAGKL